MAAALALLPPAASCTRSGQSADMTGAGSTIEVTVRSTNGSHAFHVEPARTAAEQERGLMYRTDIATDGGMLFFPYPPGGGPPRTTAFWMKNTPRPLDIVFVRADGTIARIAENAVPFDETQLSSGEPVGAILELRGGRTMALGISEGDRVTWTR